MAALEVAEQDRSPAQKSAVELLKIRLNFNYAMRQPTQLDPTEFESSWPDNHDLQRFHPSRAIVGLERRGFVLRDDYHRLVNLALTREGFAEARRLGGVPDSEIVDLDRVQANWREPDDFLLGFRGSTVWLRDDGADAIKRAERVATDPEFASLFA